jgi:hypothetical protein
MGNPGGQEADLPQCLETRFRFGIPDHLSQELEWIPQSELADPSYRGKLTQV